MTEIFAAMQNAKTEEEVKHAFAKFFSLKLDTKSYIDLYTEQILFEFKFDANLSVIQTRAACIAQTLYYIRRLKYGNDRRTPSNSVCVVTKTVAILIPTANFKDYYLKSKGGKYDWDLAPSSPCKKLVAALSDDAVIKNCHVYDFSNTEDADNFAAQINNRITNQISLFGVKKEINEDNFYPIFEYWEKLFGDRVENSHKASEYFITDIEEGKSTLTADGRIIFRMSGGVIMEKFIPVNEYQHFWSVYEKVSDPREIISIRQKMDRMSEISMRRFTGEFFTPLDFAAKAVEYLSRTVGANWYKSSKFRLWDMAAGTGNLEFALPAEALQYCYISTLLDDDAEYCKKIFPAATVFQYDYLNDDIQFLDKNNLAMLNKMNIQPKMPANLVKDLADPTIQWIIFFNPPYVTANNKDMDKRLVDKDEVSMTAVRDLMTAENLGEVSRELFSQFLYRIIRELNNRQVWIGMFSTLKYINSNNDQKFRDRIFNAEYEGGFIFSSKNFQGCKGKFPVGFLVWNLAKKLPLESQTVVLDVYSTKAEKIAVKVLTSVNREKFLNRWAVRPRCSKKFPPLSGALNVARKNRDRRDRIAEGFLASLMCHGNDFQHQNYTALLSGPCVSAGAMSVTPENFEKCMMIHAVRKIPKSTWLNNRDQFMQPNRELPREFISDAVIWSLFAPSNQTVSMRNVKYERESYRMQNNLYPFLLSEIREWRCSEPDIRMQKAVAQDDRFAALWLENHRAEISAEAAAVLSAGRQIYKYFYEKLAALPFVKYKIADWDVGWYQVRMALQDTYNFDELKSAAENLSLKLLPQIYSLGFLRDEVIEFS